LSAPGEFKATLELQGGALHEVAVEWTAVKQKLKARMARGAITNVEVSMTFTAKADVGVQNIFRRWGEGAKKTVADLGAEAQLSVEGDVRIPIVNTKVHLELGVQVDADGKPGPAFKITF